MRIQTRSALCGAAALLVATAFLGCGDRDPCADRGPAALQATLPHLTDDVVSNLVREATLCIADAVADANAPPFYTPTSDKAPVAYGLRVEPPSQFSFGMGSTVTVRTHGPSAPYMAVRVPLHVGSGLCLWSVYVCVKPGGGFAKDNPSWVVAEGSTNPAPVAKRTDEVLLYAQQRALQ
ncbi:MAG: hypothetical protein ABSA12_05205 [Verrucomicrobiia bacterium]